MIVIVFFAAIHIARVDRFIPYVFKQATFDIGVYDEIVDIIEFLLRIFIAKYNQTFAGFICVKVIIFNFREHLIRLTVMPKQHFRIKL